MEGMNKEIEIIVKAADSKKAYNFAILDISKISTVTDYFIICSGANERQTVAISDEIEDKMNKAGYKLYHHEGMRTGRWILMEYDNIIVHIFHKDEREIYDLESLWNDGKKIDAEQFGIENWR